MTKPACFSRHLCAPHGFALQAALLNEPAGKMAGLALKRAPRTGKFQGLLRPAALGQVGHFGPDGLFLSSGQSQMGPGDEPGAVGKDAVAVAQLPGPLSPAGGAGPVSSRQSTQSMTWAISPS